MSGRSSRSLNVHSVSWWLEWPAGPIRLGVVFLVAVAWVAVVVRYPLVIRDLGRDASRNSSLSYTDREVAGGNSVVADQTPLYVARALIPEDERFHVSVSPSFEGGTELTVPFVESYYRYFLMPRRVSEGAPWVICYACDRAEYGPSAETVWEGAEGISILKVDR